MSTESSSIRLVASFLAGDDGLNSQLESVTERCLIVEECAKEAAVATYVQEHKVKFDLGSQPATDSLARDMRSHFENAAEAQSLLTKLKRDIALKQVTSILMHDARNKMAQAFAVMGRVNFEILLPLADATKADLDGLIDKIRTIRIMIDTKSNCERISEEEKCMFQRQLTDIDETLHEAYATIAAERAAEAEAQTHLADARARIAAQEEVIAAKDKEMAAMQDKVANPVRAILSNITKTVMNSIPSQTRLL